MLDHTAHTEHKPLHQGNTQANGTVKNHAGCRQPCWYSTSQPCIKSSEHLLLRLAGGIRTRAMCQAGCSLLIGVQQTTLNRRRPAV